MSNREWYLEHDGPKPSLYGWIFRHMAMGAVYAALVVFGLIAILLIIYSVGELLPADSKEAPEPMPQVFYEAPAASKTHLI
ncbi:MAG: RC-LH1 core complex protein PufX [Rhodobacter sp.]|nr:RC-LH1 core complex protein PufX [Rhodobacter sp.]